MGQVQFTFKLFWCLYGKDVNVPCDISQEIHNDEYIFFLHDLFLESLFNLCEVALDFG